MPIGQEAGVTSSASACSISSNRSNGSRASRSSLLTKVMIGTSRSRQTSKSLRVCPSMPLGGFGGGRRAPSPRCRPRSDPSAPAAARCVHYPFSSDGRWIRRRPGSTIHNAPSGDRVLRTMRSSRMRSRRAAWVARGPISSITMPARPARLAALHRPLYRHHGRRRGSDRLRAG
jgi:hypothetical protein